MNKRQLLCRVLGTLLVGWLTAGAQAQTLTTLHTFQWTPDTNPTDGAQPLAGLVQGTDGLLYGTTEFGGTNAAGTVFTVTTNGTSYHTLWHFGAAGDGFAPQGGLIQGSDGNFYGATSGGGTEQGGIVFKITPGGTETILHPLVGTTQGSYPVVGVVQGSDSNFYGVANSEGINGSGTAFKITAAGALTVLHSFGAGSDGAEPAGSLLQARDGNFYGTTYRGGASGQGSLFRVTSGGVSATIHSFQGGSNPNGGYPQAGLIQGTDGWLYGTTTGGGAGGLGTVFRISTNGTYSTLHSFTNGLDGSSPQAGLVQASDGNFYGTAHDAGGTGNGTVFMITTGGVFTTVYTFTNGTDGQLPAAGLIQDCLGYLYGTTTVPSDGLNPQGTVFRLEIPLPTVAVPTISPTSGTFTNPVYVTLNCARPANAIIHYTTDGTIPTKDSPIYTGPFWLSESATIKAIGYACAFKPSSVGTSQLTINIPGARITGLPTPSTGGTVSGGGVVAHGSNVTLCATANDCSTFANWTEGGTVVSTSPCFAFVAVSNRTLLANFTLFTRTISTAVTPGGTGTATGGGPVDCGSNVTVCATANPCYKFASWTDDGTLVSSLPCYSFSAVSNRTLTANFIPSNNAIDTSATPPSAGTTSGGGTFGCGSNVTVIATPIGCYTFANWTEGGTVVSSAASYSFPAAGDRTLVAHFNPATVNISTSVTPSGSGTIGGAGPVRCGSNVTVVATPNPTYGFAHWTDGGEVVSSNAHYAFTAGGDRTLVAVFAPAPTITIAPSITNALAVIDNTTIVEAGETNVFNVLAATGPGGGASLTYQWIFGDDVTNAALPSGLASHAYIASNCGPYRASVLVSDGTVTVSTNLAVTAACNLTIAKLQIGLNFAKINSDAISLKATVGLPGVTNITQLTNKVVVVDVGDVQARYAINKKGQGTGVANSTCQLVYTKPTKKLPVGYWTATITLTKGSWHTQFAKYLLDTQLHKSPGLPVTVPVVLLLGDEVFATDQALHYISTAKSGTAK